MNNYISIQITLLVSTCKNVAAFSSPVGSGLPSSLLTDKGIIKFVGPFKLRLLLQSQYVVCATVKIPENVPKS